MLIGIIIFLFISCVCSCLTSKTCCNGNNRKKKTAQRNQRPPQIQLTSHQEAKLKEEQQISKIIEKSIESGASINITHSITPIAPKLIEPIPKTRYSAQDSRASYQIYQNQNHNRNSNTTFNPVSAYDETMIKSTRQKLQPASQRNFVIGDLDSATKQHYSQSDGQFFTQRGGYIANEKTQNDLFLEELKEKQISVRMSRRHKERNLNGRSADKNPSSNTLSALPSSNSMLESNSGTLLLKDFEDNQYDDTQDEQPNSIEIKEIHPQSSYYQPYVKDRYPARDTLEALVDKIEGKAPVESKRASILKISQRQGESLREAYDNL